MANTAVINFKRVEVSGATKEEALAAAPFTVVGDATQAYKNWKEKQTGVISEAAKKEFFANYLAKKSKGAPGLGYSITIEAAVADTRTRPYKITDVKNEQGKRHYVTTYRLVDKDTKELLASTKETKAKAKELAKNLYKEKGYKGNLICTYTKQVAEGEPVAFEVDYTPSKSSKVGTYLVFGIEA
jgi:hypothetical protein